MLLTVVGVILAVKRRKDDSSKFNNTGFTDDDILAAELVSSLASISLYWCQGLGTLQRKLNKKMKRIEMLENHCFVANTNQ